MFAPREGVGPQGGEGGLNFAMWRFAHFYGRPMARKYLINNQYLLVRLVQAGCALLYAQPAPVWGFAGRARMSRPTVGASRGL